MKTAKVVKTDQGWEPAFLWKGEWMIEPGFARPTRAEAVAQLKRDLEQSARIDAQQREYARGYDYACGYVD